MGSVQSLGVGSGLLTSELVESIIDAEREGTDLRLNAQRAELDAQISAFGGVRTSLDALQQSAAALSTSEGLLSNTATSSNPAALVASAAPNASTGIHTVEVLSLARSHTLVTGAFDDVDSVVGDGTLSLRFGTTTFAGGLYDSFVENESVAGVDIVIDENNNTLAGIRDAINSSGAPVNANIVNDGTGFVLALTSSETGAENSIEVSVTEGATAGLSAFAFNQTASVAGTNLTQTVAADDAVLNVNGIVVRRSSNTVDEVIPGVTLTALSLNVGAPTTVSVAQDVEAIEARLQTFVDSFNDAKALADELTAFDPDSGTGSLLIGDSTLRSVRNQLRRFVGGVVNDLTSTALRSLGDLGIATNQNSNFFLSFDTNRFREALANSPNDVVALLADESRASDSRIEVTNFANATEAGSYDIEVTALATQGFVEGATLAALDNPITIDDDNDNLSVIIDGGSAIAVTLSQGVYTDGADLAREIENQINLTASQGTVSVSYDTDNQRLRFASERFGQGSQVAVVSLDTNSEADLGLVIADGESTQGSDVEGLINGVPGRGTGQFLALSLGPAPAQPARLVGGEAAQFPVVIDATNNTLVATLDGIVSNNIELSQASYDNGFDLAQEIETQINADTNLDADALSVTVSYDPGNNRFVVTGNSTGQQAELVLTGLSESLATLTGLPTGTIANGVNAATRPDAAAGLQVRITGGETGSRGTATVVRGVMNQLNRFLDSTLGFDGTIENRLDLFDARLADLDEEASEFDERIENLEERLRFQFAAADALISQLNNTSSFLQQQLANLPGFTSDDG